MPTRSPTANLTLPILAATPVEGPFPWWIWVVIGVGSFLLCCCCCIGAAVAARRRRRRKEKEERERRAREKELDLEGGPSVSPPKITEVAPVPVVIEREPSIERPRTESNHLVEIPLNPPTPKHRRKPSFEELESRGAVGILWGGAEDDKQELTSERAMLKRRSEKLTREQLLDVLSQRSFSMPLEEVHEGDATGDYDYADEEEEDDVTTITVPRMKSNASNKSSVSNKSTALADSAIDFHAADQPSAVQPISVDGMSIKELKSFIVDNGGNFEGCLEKDQLVARAKEFA
jgi:hypothetical protein